MMLGFKGFASAVITIAGIAGCTASGRNSPDKDVWASKAELRLQSGTRCFGPEVCTAKQGVLLVPTISTRAGQLCVNV
jgi:hypothetical protein